MTETTNPSSSTDSTASRRTRVVLRLAAVAIVVTIAWWFAGLVGIVVALVGLGINELVGPRWVATGAAGALAVAAIATLLESDEHDFGVSSQRPMAGEAGRVAAVLLLGALSAFVARERHVQGDA
jgi:hypothetical protein